MKFETEMKPTPKQLAEAYWELCSNEQAEFFTELFKAAKMGESYFSFEIQAYWLHDHIREKNLKGAEEALMSLAAPFFYHALQERYN